jgi:hypothetical protein
LPQEIGQLHDVAISVVQHTVGGVGHTVPPSSGELVEP